MFPILTRYLVQYGEVCIPHIGTLQLVQHSPTLDVADQQFLPPTYRAQLVSGDTVTDHQFRYMVSRSGDHNCRKALLLFGEQLREAAQRSPVRWNGLGTLKFHSNHLQFDPENSIDFLLPVPAQKVIRENARHSILVGDRETDTQKVSESLTRKRSSVPWYMVAGWILLGLAVSAILFFLFSNGFETSSSGLRTRTGW